MYREVSVIEVRELLRVWLSGWVCGGWRPRPGWTARPPVVMWMRLWQRGWTVTAVSTSSVTG